MGLSAFANHQLAQLRREGRVALIRKAKKAAWWTVACIPALLAVLGVRLLSKWLLVRFYPMASDHIGHFAGDTELYLCERDAGMNAPHHGNIDVCFMGDRPLCNAQLARMWKRVLRVWPAWVAAPIVQVNRRVPGWQRHHVTVEHADLDVHNLLDRFPPHLAFTPQEQRRGQAGLREMGIPPGSSFVCLIARDNAYFKTRWPMNDLNDAYRNCDIENFALAAQTLAERGHFVIRMGAHVEHPIRVSHPRILDYATNGMRTDFMDVFLGATCNFCVTSSTGFDSIPRIFRRPVAYVNLVQWIGCSASSSSFLGIPKHHYSIKENRELSLTEVLALPPDFFEKPGDHIETGVRLLENSPEEIRDVVVEMTERLQGTWRGQADDDRLQEACWRLFPATGPYAILGEVRGRFGAAFLRANAAWLR